MAIEPSRATGAPPAVARAAVATVFLLNGIAWGSWFARIPQVREQTGIGEAALGVALLAAPLAGILVMPAAGYLIARIGSRPVTRASALGLCASLVLPSLAFDTLSLFAALAVFGACNGVMDVAMNAQGIAVERRLRRPVLSSLHAMFSVGGLVGAGVGGVAAAAGVAPLGHLGPAAALLTVLALVTCRWLPAAGDGGARAPGFARPSRPLLTLAAMAFAALMTEGAVSDWSALYLSGYLDAGPGRAALGYAVFSAAMAGGRFVGDRLVAALGAPAVVRASSLLAAAGLALAVVTSRPTVAVVGFGLVGAGVACLAPVLFAAGGRSGRAAASAGIAAITTTGYLGFVVGAPAIGLVAEHLGLPVALGGVAVLIGLVALSAEAARPADPAAGP